MICNMPKPYIKRVTLAIFPGFSWQYSPSFPMLLFVLAVMTSSSVGDVFGKTSGTKKLYVLRGWIEAGGLKQKHEPIVPVLYLLSKSRAGKPI